MKEQLKVKSLISMIVTCYQIEIVIAYNQFFYFLKRIPLIKKLVPDAVFKQKELKGVIAVIGAVYQLVLNILTKSLYAGIMLFVPVYFLVKEGGAEAQYKWFINALFVLSLLAGSFIKETILTNTENKYVNIKLMRIPAKHYLISEFVLLQAVDFISFAIVFGVVHLIYNRGFWGGILWAAMIVLGRLGGQAYLLYCFDKKGEKHTQRWYVAYPLLLGTLVLAYGPMFLQMNINIGRFLFHPAGIVLIVIISMISLKYILGYQRYRWIASEIVDIHAIEAAKQTVQGAAFADVTLKDEDVRCDVEQKLDKKEGFDYLNALFFERHKRMLFRPIKIRLIGVGIVFLAGVMLTLIEKSYAGEIMKQVMKRLPVFVFVIYALTTSSERICKAMFKNCDISLLHYGFYRKPEAILSNFRYRLRHIMKPNMLLCGAIAGGIAVLTFMSGADWDVLGMISFVIAILILGIFYSVHYLFLYYFFQPYTSELAIKNPFYSAVHWVIYILGFICLNMDYTPVYFTLILFVVTIGYILVALALIWKFAPKNFKIKQ